MDGVSLDVRNRIDGIFYEALFKVSMNGIPDRWCSNDSGDVSNGCSALSI